MESITQKVNDIASSVASTITKSSSTAEDASGPSEPSIEPDMIIQEEFKPVQQCTLEPKENIDQTIVASVLRLYSYDTNSSYLDVLSDDVEFEDPISYAKGKDQVISIFNSLKSFCSDSQTISSEVVSYDAEKVTFNLKQLYTIKGIGSSKEIDSTVDLLLDTNGKITRIEERWNNQPLRRKESSMDIIGMVAEKCRYLTGKVVGAVVSSAPSPRTE